MKRLLFVLLVGCGSQVRGAEVPSWVTDTSSFKPGTAEAPRPASSSYAAVAAKIIAAARPDRGAYVKLSYLTDRIGARLAGSPQLDKAIAWATQALKDDGHDARAEPVMVPHWVRGLEQAAITAPIERPLRVLGLGGTVPTPKGGLVAPVVVVRSWAELESKPEVKGAIVLFDVAMPAWTEEKGSGYGELSQYRTRGPSRAAKAGAAAVLMRSLTAHSLRTPHTGAVNYDPAVAKIPAAAVTVEDSMLIARLAAQGPVTVRMQLDSQQLPDAQSANVIGELRGRDLPDEVVVLGAHLDSWDVGQGAHDDGAGVVTMMQALTTLRKLGLQPRRTIRVVLFTNEENGVRGGKTYAEAHKAELARTVFALEADSGGFPPRGISFEAPAAAVPRVQKRLGDLVALLSPLGSLRVTAGHSGSDVGHMVPGGVIAGSLETFGKTYFDYHHTEADTLDKVDPASLADDVAAAAAIAYMVADLPDRLDAP